MPLSAFLPPPSLPWRAPQRPFRSPPSPSPAPPSTRLPSPRLHRQTIATTAASAASPSSPSTPPEQPRREQPTPSPPRKPVPPSAPSRVRAARLVGGRLSATPDNRVIVGPGEPIAPRALLARAPLSEAFVVARRGLRTASTSGARREPVEPWVRAFVGERYWRASEWDARLVCCLLYHTLCGGRSLTGPARDGGSSKSSGGTPKRRGATARSGGRNNARARYVASLDRDVYTAADLTGDALADIQYQPAMDAVECFQYRVASECDRFRAALVERGLRRAVTPELYMWAMKIVHSRAFAIPAGGHAAAHTRPGLMRTGASVSMTSAPTGSGLGASAEAGGHAGFGTATSPFATSATPTHYALVPGLDKLSHGGRAHTKAELRFNSTLKTFDLLAGDQSLAPGAHVTVNFGSHLTNDDLFLLYGFVEAGNPADVHQIDQLVHWAADDPVNRDWNLFDAKLRLLRQAGLCYDGRKYVVSRTHIDPHLAASLRVLLADPNEFQSVAAPVADAAARASKANLDPDTRAAICAEEVSRVTSRPLSLPNETRVWTRIHVQLRRLLAEYPTSLDLDEEMITLLAASSLPPDPHVSTPLLFRVEKKRILVAAIDLAEKHASRLVAAARAVGLELSAMGIHNPDDEV